MKYFRLALVKLLVMQDVFLTVMLHQLTTVPT